MKYALVYYFSTRWYLLVYYRTARQGLFRKFPSEALRLESSEASELHFDANQDGR